MVANHLQAPGHEGLHHPFVSIINWKKVPCINSTGYTSGVVELVHTILICTELLA